METQIHDKEVLIEKLSLKNTTYKAAIAKLEAQLAHKEEMGEVRAGDRRAQQNCHSTATFRRAAAPQRVGGSSCISC
jgi:hypothetical protein